MLQFSWWNTSAKHGTSRTMSRSGASTGVGPDITPEEYQAAVKIYHAREFPEPKIVKRRLPEILSRLKNKSGYMTKAIFSGVSWKKKNGSWYGKANWSL